MTLWRMILALIPAPYRVLASLAAIAALLAALGAGYGLWHHKVYSAGYAAATDVYEARMAAQAEANRQAVAKANQALMEAADRLSLKSLELDDALSKLDAAADAGAGAHKLGLEASRVKALGAIR